METEHYKNNPSSRDWDFIEEVLECDDCILEENGRIALCEKHVNEARKSNLLSGKRLA